MRVLFIVVGILELLWGVVSLLFNMEDVAKGTLFAPITSLAYTIALLASGTGFFLAGILKYALNWWCVASLILIHLAIYASGEVLERMRNHANYTAGLEVTGALFIAAIVFLRSAHAMHQARNKKEQTQHATATLPHVPLGG